MSGTRRKAGLLGPQVEGYRAWLARRGYTPGTVRNMLKDLGQVGLWLSARGAGRRRISTRSAMAAFLSARQRGRPAEDPGVRARWCRC